MARVGLQRDSHFGAKKSSFVAIARPPTRADARSARIGERRRYYWRSSCSSDTAYGKSRIRLVQVSRGGDRHDLRDLTVAVRFEGRLRRIVHRRRQPRRPADRHDEEHGLRAGRRASGRTSRRPSAWCSRGTFSSGNPRLRTRARRSHRTRVGAPRHRRPRARRMRSCAAARTRAPPRVQATPRADARSAAACANLLILKSSHSAFAGFPRDEYTTLPETHDRLLATSLDRDLATTARPTSTSARAGSASGGRCSRRLPSTTAHRCSTRSTRWARRCSTTWPTSTVDPSRDAEQASPAGRPVALRPREPQRDLRRHRRAARADRSDARPIARDGMTGARWFAASGSCCRTACARRRFRSATAGSSRSARTRDRPAGVRGDRRRRRSWSCRVSSTRTSTSTSPAAPTGKASRHATRAAAAGGVTTLVDMPLNSIPATTTCRRARGQAARGQRPMPRGRRLLGRRRAGQRGGARTARARRRPRFQVLSQPVGCRRIRARHRSRSARRRCRSSRRLGSAAARARRTAGAPARAGRGGSARATRPGSTAGPRPASTRRSIC